ncbi:hypothetical protein HK405_014873, partial [Cladochytrium tenue]
AVGNAESAIQQGIIPRAFTHLHEAAQPLRDKGWAHEFEAQLLLLAGSGGGDDALRDLLAPTAEEKKLEIRQTGAKTCVSDATT